MEFKEITSNEVQSEKDVLMASCGINEEHQEEPKAQILVETKKLDLSSGEEEVILPWQEHMREFQKRRSKQRLRS